MFNLRNKNHEPQEVTLTLSTESYVRLAIQIIATILLIYAVRKASHSLLLIFTAFFLALALNAPVKFLSERFPGRLRGSRSLATSVSFLTIVILLGAFIASIVPPLIKQTDTFVKAAPQLVQDVRSQNGEVGQIIRRYHLQDQVDTFSKQLSERLKHLGGTAFATVQRVGSSAFSLLTILVLTFMMLVEGPQWLKFSKDIIPDQRQDLASRLAADMYKVIKGFVNGQVTLAALASVLIVPAILILHISYPIALMVVVFVCGLIPMVGHTIGAIIVTAVALSHSITSAIIILIYYILYQQMENYLLQPRIQANSTNMSPLLIFISVVIGVSFGGLVGGLFAIPLAGCIRILVLEYLRSKRIIDSAEFASATSETR